MLTHVSVQALAGDSRMAESLACLLVFWKAPPSPSSESAYCVTVFSITSRRLTASFCFMKNFIHPPIDQFYLDPRREMYTHSKLVVLTPPVRFSIRSLRSLDHNRKSTVIVMAAALPCLHSYPSESHAKARVNIGSGEKPSRVPETGWPATP
jgi:hypothetical protein